MESGLIDGYADGTFRPGNTLTGFAFLKMLLTALGYDSAIEGYTGTNWTVNVAGRATQVGLTDGNDEFVGSRAATREEACLYAVNALKATLVEYESKGTNVTVNGATVAIGASYTYIYFTSSIAGAATSIDDTKDNQAGDYTVEFAERYQPDLELDSDTDPFGRPSHTWSWKGNEIGTYVDYDLMIAEYTTKVTYKDLYNDLGRNVLTNYDVSAYIDGVDDTAELAKITRSNTETFGETGNGVLTQVFVDPTAGRDGEAVVAVINTYLAEAQGDYRDRNGYATLEVNGITTDAKGNYVKDAGSTGNEKSLRAYTEDFAIVEDIVDGDMFLVTVADKEIQSIADPELVSEVSINSFKKGSWVVSEGSTYDYADSATYNKKVLDQYDDVDKNMKDTTYNLYLDQYGYMIGVEIVDAEDSYVFITGYEDFGSKLTSAKAEARAIFTDGTVSMITVKDAKETIGKDGKTWTSDGRSNENAWYTYGVDKNGDYELTIVDYKLDASKDIDVAQGQDKTAGREINKSHVSLNMTNTKQYVYGNDDTVFLGADLNKSETQITGVKTVVTGVKNVNMKLDVDGNPPDGAYVLYDEDHYVIAAVVVGQNLATAENYAYIISGVHQEDYDAENDEWTWYRDAIVNGEEVTLREKGSSLKVLGTGSKGGMSTNNWYEISYDADGYVIDSDTIDWDVIADLDSETYATASVQGFNDTSKAGYDKEDVTLVMQEMNTTDFALVLEGLTVYVRDDKKIDSGISIVPGAPVALLDKWDGASDYDIEYFDGGDGNDNMADAMDAMASTKYSGYIYFVMEDGVATSIIIVDDIMHYTGNTPVVPSGKYSVLTATTNASGNIAVKLNKAPTGTDVVTAEVSVSTIGSNVYTPLGECTFGTAQSVRVQRAGSDITLASGSYSISVVLTVNGEELPAQTMSVTI